MNEPTHLDLFSGIGGFALAAKWAGFRTVAFCEFDEYCQRVLSKHWPGVACHADIRHLDGKRYAGQIDLLTGGFPCQPFSCAGKQRGKEDNRFIWSEMLRVIQEVKPTWVIGENVAGIVNLALDDCLADLEGAGYSALPFIIPACAVDAKHKRDRVWIVAYNDRKGLKNLERGQGSTKPTRRHFALPGISERGLHIWQNQPYVERVVYGIPDGLDRLKALGNAIVPQVAFQIIRAIRQQLP